MRINKIEIYNFRGLSSVIIDNLDKNLNLFIGINGAGKSSILDAVALLLQSYTARLTSSSGRGISIKTSDIRKRTQGCKLFVWLDSGISWSRYRFNVLEKREEGNLRELFDSTYSTRLSLDNGESVCLPVIAHYGVNRAVSGMVSTLPFRNSMVIEETGKPSDTYKNWWNRGSLYRDFFLWFKEEEAEENRRRITEHEYRDRGLQAIRDAMKIVFPDYSGMGMLSKFQLGLKKDGEMFPFDYLSDGEKCYITLVCDIVRRLTIANPTGDILKGDGIVLIDEVDLHLHPSWETTVMEKLNATFPNIQFIVSAHSPLVASHFDGQVFGVRNGEVEPLPRIHGLDYSTILLDYMGVRPDNREVSSLVELYRSYSRHGMKEPAEAVYNRLVELMHGDLNAAVFKTLLK